MGSLAQAPAPRARELDPNESSVPSVPAEHTPAESNQEELNKSNSLNVEFNKDTFVKFLSLLPVQHKYSSVRNKNLCKRVVLPTASLTGKGIVGINSCGNTYACPCCGYTRSVANANKLIRIMENASKDGKRFYLVTLTTDTNRQNTYEQVENVSTRFRNCRRNLTKFFKRRGKSVVLTYNADDTFSVEGLVKVHHHYHVLVMADGDIDPVELDNVLWEKWNDQNEKDGITLVRSAFYFKEVDTNAAAVKYLYKTAFEVVGKNKTGYKNRLSISGLLAYIGETEDKRAIKLYNDFEKATKGKNSFYIPKAMKEYLGEEVEQDNEEAARQEQEEAEKRITPRPIGQCILSAMWSSKTFTYISWLLRHADDEDDRIIALNQVLDTWECELESVWNGYNEFVALLRSWYGWAAFYQHSIEPDC